MSPFSPSCPPLTFLMLNTLVSFTYFEVRARLSIFHLRLLSDRRTILIGRWPHLAMIPSLGKSWFEWTFVNSLTPWTTLSNCPRASANNLTAVLKPLTKVSKHLDLVSKFPNTKAGGAGWYKLYIIHCYWQYLSQDVNMHFGQFNKIFTCPLFGKLVCCTSGGDH